MKTIFLFPGQGAQKVGMLKDFPRQDAITAAVFAETEEFLGQPVAALDTNEKLSSTVYAQLCLLIAGVISARRLQAAGVQPDFVSGHSVGAFAAAVISEVLTFKEGLALVHLRGQLMEQAYPQDYGMAALTGISEAALQRELTIFNKDHETLYLSNVNSPDQQVVAGKLSGLALLIRKLQGSGIRKAQLLNMSVPSHCPLLNGVSKALEQQLAGLELQEPSIPYAANRTGRLLRTKEAIREDLYKSVAATVRWYDATSLLYELGGRLFIEMQPAGILAKIAESTFPEAKVLAMNAGNTDTIVWLWKNYQQKSNDHINNIKK
jgi:malonate decarboxylase epsilon subunit